MTKTFKAFNGDRARNVKEIADDIEAFLKDALTRSPEEHATRHRLIGYCEQLRIIAGELKEGEVKQSPKRKFWGMFEMNTPFRVGGPAVTPYRYAVMAEEVKLLKFNGFVYQHNGEWRVHEMSTGGCLCSGSTRQEAVESARKLIKITPDFGKQIKALSPVMQHEEMSFDEAMKRIGESKEKNPAEMVK